ncbi:ShKT domain-containing protein [Caenorhabditis elegans]|uniref:ShKT domain-containing protein n=1 Tax=Caenorhabditis elegans TaxID=6239 RepID=G5EEU8_CAEEL|nr:ShKT domain-containing protein [Caenorhabditis elegans]NP_506988.1 ShKT domain-containing protein [Caenorhabditis elegans]CAB04291.1 ShKT domain-containing protein [Caenorhabditis elegans]CAB04297.1 ShKT domain-containing protein [Caenorhabditis elegans]|eukprot:NP_506985.1 Uncharacterized protein CELE_F35E8.10 [Caenorhabditis elegans]
MIALVSFILALLAPQASAVIGGDLNCTSYNGTAFVWNAAATACSNVISDSSCAVLYPAPVAADGYPSPGRDQQRPLACYTTATATPAAVVQDMKNAAQSTCPRTCGLCCQTSGYNCPNVAYPRLNCGTITASQCLSPVWRPIIAADCPSACGFCNEGGCVDAIPDCANDIRICTAAGLETFVATYCQRTCGKCASSTTTRSSASTGTCSSFIADTSPSCAAWAGKNFCTNTFYTLAQRRQYCATTCRIC